MLNLNNRTFTKLATTDIVIAFVYYLCAVTEPISAHIPPALLEPAGKFLIYLSGAMILINFNAALSDLKFMKPLDAKKDFAVGLLFALSLALCSITYNILLL